MENTENWSSLYPVIQENHDDITRIFHEIINGCNNPHEKLKEIQEKQKEMVSNFTKLQTIIDKMESKRGE